MSPEPQRGGSVPRQNRENRGPRSPLRKLSPELINKSKSLPPSKAENNKKVELTSEEKAQKLAEEKIKNLSSPEREKLLQRRKKFESNLPIKPVAKKISLKKTQESSVNETNTSTKKRQAEDNGDDISLDVNDTLDMFEEKSVAGATKNRRQAKGK